MPCIELREIFECTVAAFDAVELLESLRL